MAFGDADLAMMLSDVFAVPVVLPGPVTTSGIEDYYDLVQFGEDGSSQVIGRARGVVLLTSLVGSLTDGSAITVNGTARTVRGQPLAQGDGAKSLVYLRG
jgi:hypothetical protein